MDNYLLDRETLGKFVDDLMKRKPMDVSSPEELDALRERSMQELDDKISVAVFGSLNDEQLAQINVLLDQDEQSPEVFQKFFEDNNVDVEKIMEETFLAYAKEFLGGENE